MVTLLLLLAENALVMAAAFSVGMDHAKNEAVLRDSEGVTE